MLMLALDASAKAASAALARDGVLLGQYFQNCGLTHSATLLPMAEALLKNCGLSVSDVDIFAVTKGPGSFTGVRIGVATVKGLAWAQDKPCIGVSTLEAMAWNGLCAPEGSLICCAMDARRNQVYNALFCAENGQVVRLCPDRAISLAELVADIRAREDFSAVFVTGDGASLTFAALQEAGIPAILAPEVVRHQCAWGACLAAQGKTPESVHDLLPSYLRLSQAERERQARLAREENKESQI